MKKLNYLLGVSLASVLMLASFTLSKNISSEINTINKEGGMGECGKCRCECFRLDKNNKPLCKCGHGYKYHKGNGPQC